MTKAEAAAAKQRCEKATPGPWYTRSNDASKVFCVIGNAPTSMPLMVANTIWNNRNGRQGRTTSWVDGEMIANSRTDLPAAINMLERAMDKIGFLTASHDLECKCSSCALFAEWHGEEETR